MRKKLLNKKKIHNQGNSYIMVVATLSFLAVLVATLLVAVALCYRLKAYDINARDNFYYLEQAMDEIYAGVGSDAMVHLNTAYNETIEVLVYFDPVSQSYVTMKDNDANDVLKNTYMKLLKSDPRYKTKDTVQTRLKALLSNPVEKDSEGVALSVGGLDVNDEQITVQNLVLKREATYSTVNTRKTVAPDTFVQSITTDIVIGKPEFNVNFNTINSNLSALYDFAFVADKGIEIGNATTKVNITGNIYAAADFYNKDYNLSENDKKKIKDKSDNAYMFEKDDKGVSRVKNDYLSVSNYDSEKNANCNGLFENSMYSGIYINGADVFIAADKVIVPGSISAFNSANLALFGISEDDTADIWADGIVLGGYSFLKSANSSEVQGSVVEMRANAYIADDLEINAESSSMKMVGRYFGYNYASLDNRTYTDACIQANGKRTFVSSVDPQIKDGSTIEGQAHYNSSAIIVNGQNASLDLSSVTDMYIAGQAYIETSKTTTTTKTDKINGEDVVNSEGDVETVTYNQYDYPEKSSATTEVYEDVTEIVDGSTVYVTEEKNGQMVRKKEKVTRVVEDNYTTNTKTVDNKKNLPKNPTKEQEEAASSTNVQDYRTGEAISIKSNQLAYIPSYAVTDTADGLYLKIPEAYKNNKLFTDYFDDVTKIPIIKTKVSGKTYYFFDFSTDSTVKARKKLGDNTADYVMNEFIAEYAKMFKVDASKATSDGEDIELTDITDYGFFEVEMLNIDTDADDGDTADDNEDYANIYSNSAITVKNGTTFTIKAKSSSIDPLMTAARLINADINTKISYGVNDSSIVVPEPNATSTSNEGYIKDGSGNVDTNVDTSIKNRGTAAIYANSVTTKLQSQYKEVKWMLTTTSSDPVGVQNAHTMKDSEITPINYYFNFNLLPDPTDPDYLSNDLWKKLVAGHKLNSGYKVWASKGDIHVKAGSDFSNGNVKGLVICMGDVTFDDDVKNFEGLIVSGSKVKIDDSISFTANEEIIKTILRECDESQKYGEKNTSFFGTGLNTFLVCQLFNHYKPYYEPTSSTGGKVESTKSISAVQFEDIVSFNNWKKNVD